MIGYYLQTAFRHFMRFRYSTIANVLCLSFGMTCFLCAYSVFAYFASSESGFTDSDKIYVIVTKMKKGSDDPVIVAGIPPGMIKYIKSEIPELQSASFTSNLLGTISRTIRVGDKTLDWFRPIVADKNFLTMLDIPMISGDRETSLSTPDSMVIGADAAVKLFGTKDVKGKIAHFDNGVDVTITGVLGPLPIPTHLAMLGNQAADGRHYLDAIIPWQVEQKLMWSSFAAQNDGMTPKISFDEMLGSMKAPAAMAYFTLPANDSVASLNQKLSTLVQRHFSGRRPANGQDPISYTVSVIPVKQVLSTFVDSTATLLGMPLTQLLVLCGLIVLCVAIINYANLYTTQLVGCRHEIRVQHLLGATKMQLATQCLLETLLTSLAALTLALMFFKPLKGPISSNSFVEFNTEWLSGWHYWLVLGCLVTTVSILASLYPVSYLSRINSSNESRSKSERWSTRSAMYALVATQFSITGALLILILVAGQQNSEIKRLALSHLNDPVVSINNDLGHSHVAYQVLAEHLKQYPQIKSVTAASGQLWSQGFAFEPNSISTHAGWQAARQRVDVEEISFGFLDTMNMRLLEGRDFDSNKDKASIEIPPPTAPSPGFARHAIVDRSLAEALGYKNISTIINTELYGHGQGLNNFRSNGVDMNQFRIIGVVEDTYLAMTGTHNVGTVFILGNNNTKPLVRIGKQDINGGLQAIDTVWKQLAPNVPINRQFLKDQYRMPGLIAQAFWILSFLLVLAITISVLGVIGVAIHTVARRTREISIRKSLGASNADILKLLLSIFTSPVVIANIFLAWPFGYLLSRAYLSLFTYRVALGPLPFLISLLITVGIVCLAVGVQVFRAARRNPAEVFRYE